ncbi:hypothetical protein Tco_0669437 [Tanacetum coccineum]
MRHDMNGTESNNDGEDFVHPKFSTHDDEVRQEEVNEEYSFDPRVQTKKTPFTYVESTDEITVIRSSMSKYKKKRWLKRRGTQEDDKENELYRDVNVNLKGRDTVMTDAPLPNVQATQETEDTHVILTAPIIPKGQQQGSSVSSGFVSNMLNPRPDTGIDSIFNTEATSLVDVPVTTIVEPPLMFATTLYPPPTPLITHMQQTPFPIPTTAPKNNQGPSQRHLSTILLQILSNAIEKIVNEQLEAEVMTRSTTESKKSLAIATNLSELGPEEIH